MTENPEKNDQEYWKNYRESGNKINNNPEIMVKNPENPEKIYRESENTGKKLPKIWKGNQQESGKKMTKNPKRKYT